MATTKKPTRRVARSAAASGPPAFQPALPVARVDEVLATLRIESPAHIGVDTNQRTGWIGMDPARVGHAAA